MANEITYAELKKRLGISDLINRQHLFEYLCETTPESDWLVNQYNADWIYSWIESQPTIDAVEVVRCKDCKHCVLTVDGEYNPQDIVCEWWQTDGLKATAFCSYGERRGEDETS